MTNQENLKGSAMVTELLERRYSASEARKKLIELQLYRPLKQRQVHKTNNICTIRRKLGRPRTGDLQHRCSLAIELRRPENCLTQFREQLRLLNTFRLSEVKFPKVLETEHVEESEEYSTWKPAMPVPSTDSFLSTDIGNAVHIGIYKTESHVFSIGSFLSTGCLSM